MGDNLKRIKGAGLSVLDVEPFEIERCEELRVYLAREGLFTDSEDRWRLSPSPFYLSQKDYAFLESLGSLLLSFYLALNKLYYRSTKRNIPAWVMEYLDMGKPDFLLRYGRMNRFRQHLPIIIRPDIILTETGMVATELDAVPGGMGITAAISAFYSRDGDIIGGGFKMVEDYMDALRLLSPEKEPNVAIVVSEESRDYRPEMAYLSREFNKRGLKSYILTPEELIFTEDGLWVEAGGEKRQIHILYRFFELFDIVNIPKAELIFYAAKKKRVVLTPPIKPFLEEKLSYALFHHPALKGFWVEELGEDGYYRLKALFPLTWVLDPRPIPPYGTISFIEFRGDGVISWDFLKNCTQKERRYVIKPSGFSELAWGGKGVMIGHDEPLSEWIRGIDNALSSFYSTPYILQEFKKGRRLKARFYNREKEVMEDVEVRARLTPYYFVCGKKVRLSGCLATLCPSDKKILHGMKDAIMVPCALEN